MLDCIPLRTGKQCAGRLVLQARVQPLGQAAERKAGDNVPALYTGDVVVLLHGKPVAVSHFSSSRQSRRTARRNAWLRASGRTRETPTRRERPPVMAKQ